MRWVGLARADTCTCTRDWIGDQCEVPKAPPVDPAAPCKTFLIANTDVFIPASGVTTCTAGLLTQGVLGVPQDPLAPHR
jgi:hypothetical protein